MPVVPLGEVGGLPAVVRCGDGLLDLVRCGDGMIVAGVAGRTGGGKRGGV